MKNFRSHGLTSLVADYDEDGYHLANHAKAVLDAIPIRLAFIDALIEDFRNV